MTAEPLTPEEEAMLAAIAGEVVAARRATDVPVAEGLLTIECPSCEGKGELMTGYYEPEATKCWTCDGRRTISGRAALATPEPDA